MRILFEKDMEKWVSRSAKVSGCLFPEFESESGRSDEVLNHNVTDARPLDGFCKAPAEDVCGRLESGAVISG